MNESSSDYYNETVDSSFSLSFIVTQNTNTNTKLYERIVALFYSKMEAEDSHSTYYSDRWQQIVEMAICISALVTAYWFNGWKVLDRPTPYQYLAQNDEYVRDLVHDEHLNYHYFVDNSSLHIVSIFVPLVVQTVGSLLLLQCQSPWFDELHGIVSCTCFALALDTWITYAIKCYVGYLRPVYYDHCVPFEDYHGCSIDKSFIHVSFPSSHSSLSFCGMTLLALFLDRTWRQYRSRCRWIQAMESTPVKNNACDIFNLLPVTYWERFVSLFLVMVPMAVALLVSCTRIYNNYHYPADVLTGAVLGGAIAVFCHSLWFDQGRTIQMVQVFQAEEADVVPAMGDSSEGDESVDGRIVTVLSVQRTSDFETSGMSSVR